jgi:two-component system sensor histidine kinase RegB
MHNRPLPLTTPVQHLRHLVVIRTLVLGCLFISAALSFWLTSAALPYVPILLILIILSTINLLTFFRLRRELPVTDIEFFTQLLIDVLCLSLLFYSSGGANNPFVFYFLVPICISAATLSWSYTWVVTLLCIASYTALLFFNIPLPALSPDHGQHHLHQPVINLHILGMWVNFFISAVLITYFVVRMARDLRHQDQLLNRRREDELRDDQLMAVATLAAGTAHELGTPLSTMKVLLNELRDEYREPAALQQDLQLLTAQVEQCSLTLRQLVEKAEQTKSGNYNEQLVGDFCNTIIERWQVMRPEVSARIAIAHDSANIKHAFHPTISQSIINLLNNAADANPENIIIRVQWSSSELTWQIEDNGPGVPLELSGQLGKAFITTKGHGLGLGLFLTHATLNRYGGQVRLYNRKPQGTLTELVLPLLPQTFIGENTNS